MRGGLSNQQVMGYWEKRSAAQGVRTVGFSNLQMSKQDKNYAKRISFVTEFLDTYVKTIDYGCGIGRYSDLFDSENYLGMDITQNLIDAAVERNPEHRYLKLNQPHLPSLDFNFEQFFTATVLQHNDDLVVENIIKSILPIKADGFSFVLYENSSPSVFAPHMCPRSPERYRDIVSKVFEVKDFKRKSHVVHGEEHSICVIKV